MRQMQTLALLLGDLHRKSVVPIVQSLMAVQGSDAPVKAGKVL